MTCHEFIKQIAAYPLASLQTLLEGHAKTDQDADLRKHLSSCPACVEQMESERQFHLLIKGHAPKVQAPASLLDKVLARVAREGLRESANPRIHEPRFTFHVSRFTFRPFAISLAAVCVLALIALFSWMPWRSEHAAIFAVVDDHIRYLPSEEQRQIVSSNRAEVEAWFTGQLDFAVKIPELNDLRLLGGRRCYLFGQRVALLFYEQAGKKLSLFILEDRDLNPGAMSWRNHGNKKVGLAACKGYNLVFWRQNGLAYALVSDLPPQILLDLTSQL